MHNNATIVSAVAVHGLVTVLCLLHYYNVKGLYRATIGLRLKSAQNPYEVKKHRQVHYLCDNITTFKFNLCGLSLLNLKYCIHNKVSYDSWTIFAGK